MKKPLTILLTMFMSLSLIAFNTKGVKAQETVTSITQAWYNQCVIDSGGDKCNINGKYSLKENINIDKYFNITGNTTIDLNGKQITANLSGFTFAYDGVDDISLTMDDSVGTGKVTASKPGIAFCNLSISGSSKNGTLTINGGTFSNFDYDIDGGAFFNRSNDTSCVYTFNMTGGKIENCHNNLGDYGGIIATDSVNISGGTIENCSVKGENQPIFLCYNSNVGKFTMTGGEIKNCKNNKIINAGFSFFPTISITGGTIKDCGTSVDKYAIEFGSSYLSSSELILGGNIDIDNTNEEGLKKDILITNKLSRIKVNGDFNPTKKIGVLIDPNSFTDIGIDLISAPGYTGTLIDKFISLHANQFMKEDTVNKVLRFESIQTTKLPYFSNKFKIETDNDPTKSGVNVAYQWYKTDEFGSTQLGDVGDYKVTKNHTITLDTNDCGGVYSSVNKTWTYPADKSSDFLSTFKITKLRKGQTISFDYSINGTPNEYFNFIIKINGNDKVVIGPEKTQGSIKYVIEDDLNEGSTLTTSCYNVDSEWQGIDVVLSNIVISEAGDGDPIQIENLQNLLHPESDGGVYCVYTLTGDKKISATHKSPTVSYGSVLEGNHQSVEYKKTQAVTIKYDTTATDHNYFTGANGGLYLDGCETTNKIADNKYLTTYDSGTKVTLNSDFVASLKPGIHSIIVKKSDTLGEEAVVATLNITSTPKPTDTPAADEMKYDSTKSMFIYTFIKGLATIPAKAHIEDIEALTNVFKVSKYNETTKKWDALASTNYTIDKSTSVLNKAYTKVSLNTTYLNTLDIGTYKYKIDLIDGVNDKSFDILVTVKEKPLPYDNPNKTIGEMEYKNNVVGQVGAFVQKFYKGKTTLPAIAHIIKCELDTTKSDIIYNGQSLDKKNYTIENKVDGSGKPYSLFTLKKDYLNTLDAGDHQFTILLKGDGIDLKEYVVISVNPIPSPIQKEGDMEYDKQSNTFKISYEVKESTKDGTAHFAAEEPDTIVITNLDTTTVLTIGRDYSTSYNNKEIGIALKQDYLNTLEPGTNNLEISIDGNKYGIEVFVTKKPEPTFKPGDMEYDKGTNTFSTQISEGGDVSAVAHFVYTSKTAPKVILKLGTNELVKNKDFNVEIDKDKLLKLTINSSYLSKLEENIYTFNLCIDDENTFDIEVNVVATPIPTPTPSGDDMKYIDNKGFVNSYVVGKASTATAHIENVTYLLDSVVVINKDTSKPLEEGKDYDVSNGSIKVTFKQKYLNSLSVGTHILDIIVTKANIPTHFKVTITVAPDVVPGKDESCEKVIGPSWHWNNKKGICEDTGVVKTYTR